MRAIFDGPVSGVDASDFRVVGGTTANVTDIGQVNDNTYQLTIFGR